MSRVAAFELAEDVTRPVRAAPTARIPVATKPTGAPYIAPTLRDPGIMVGRFKILPRTDGSWIAYDEARPLGERTACVGSSLEHAQSIAGELLEEERKAAERAGES